MENNATKKQKRLSLTLSNRLHQKRHSASPQNRVRASAPPTQPDDPPGSPTMRLISDGDSIECTPPHRKSLSLDDSVDFSPRLDISLSPSCMFSQSLVTESPEVSWRWNRSSSSNSNNNNNNINSHNNRRKNTATDSGIDSAGSEQHRQDCRHESKHTARRNQLDEEQWRAQQSRTRELLQQRYDKLNRQLEESAPRKRPAKPPTPPPLPQDDALTDFLNDSDTDCFLLQATQQIESSKKKKKTPAVVVEREPVATTPTSHHKEKQQRPSFYMQFLEDESDDWLAALDEAAQLVSTKKARNSLQRYKSMPSDGAGVATSAIVPTSVDSRPVNDPDTTPRIKRHASSHAFSPSTSHGVRGKLFPSRK